MSAARGSAGRVVGRAGAPPVSGVSGSADRAAVAPTGSVSQPGRPAAVAALSVEALIALRAALSAGVSPAAALSSVDAAAFAPVVAHLRAGRRLADVAAGPTAGLAEGRLLLLVRGLALAEGAGGGACAAVDQVLAALDDDARTERLVRTRSTQARATAALLTVLPVAAGGLLALVLPASRGLWTHPIGLVIGAAAAACMAGGWWWSRRLIARARQAALWADPLLPAAPRRWDRAAALAVPALIVGGWWAGPVVGAGLAVLAGLIGLRRPRPEHAAEGGAVELIELIAIALRAGLTAPAAVEAVGRLAGAHGREVLQAAARRLRAGWPVGAAFADGPLAGLGTVLEASARWGAPAGPALERLAGTLRAERRASAEIAAERAELFLVFPTTLLILPAFLLTVVAPLVWSAVAGWTGSA